jgi:hydroxymethylbilane synthase
VRRAAQLRAARPDLRIEPIRGNLDTRIAKLTGARASPVAYDAIVVAVAGCRRLGLDETITEILPLDLMLPAPGQGALAVEVRQDHTEIAQMVASLDDPAARQAVDSERACLRALGGGCRVPIAAMAEASGDSLVLRARVLSADGARVVEAERSGPHTDAEGLGERVASELLAHGAGEILGLIEDR